MLRIFFNSARPYSKEVNPLTLTQVDPKVRIVEDGDRVFLEFKCGPEWKKAETRLVTTGILGKAAIPQLAIENADGLPLVVDMDYSGQQRSTAKPSPGPFENPSDGNLRLKVW